MKWIKWIVPILTVLSAVIAFFVLKHQKDWENDFAQYSTRMLFAESNYVEQPAYNMIGEEQFFIGQTENEHEKYYFTQLKNNPDVSRIYSYNKENKETKLLYEVETNLEWGMLCFVSGNGKKLVLDFTDRVVLVDIDTQISKVIFSGRKDSSAINGQTLYYSDANGNIYAVDLKSNEKKELEGIKATVFVIYNDLLYFLDLNNNGCATTYNLSTGEIISLNEYPMIGFELKHEEICFR